MVYLKLFENFEIVEPINYGEPLNNKEISFLKGYNIICPEFILKDDNYYYAHDHRCENIKDVPLTYINGLCSKYNIQNYTINDDYTIDVDDKVDFFNKSLYKIPLKFNKVSKGFNCDHNRLTTLEGSPKYVGGDFSCLDNKLTTLEGGPEKVVWRFSCFGNKLTTLEGSPKYVGGDFDCNENKLTTLEGGPEYVGGDFYCSMNSLKSVEYKGVIKGGIIR